MGFRTGSFATVWETRSVSNTFTKVRLSISRKNKNTGEYEQDFSGFCDFVGSACADKALKLKERDRIKLGDVDVTNRYDKERGKEFTNFKVFDFSLADDNGGGGGGGGRTQSAAAADESDYGDDLPF